MERSFTPLKAVLGGLAIAVVGLLGVLILQATRPTIADAQPPNGSAAPRGEVRVGAEVRGEATLREVRLRVDGEPVQPVIVARSERHWSVSYRVALPRGEHQAELVVVDQRGREQPYRWGFTAAGPATPPRFADPAPRAGARLAAGEVAIALAAFAEGERLGALALSLNDAPLVTARGNAAAGERTVAAGRRALAPGDYTVRAAATDTAGTATAYEWTFAVVEPDGADARFFPETGLYVFAPFAAHWARTGGQEVNGLPLTPELARDGLMVQWFERARFERDGGLPEGQVQLGLLGAESRPPDPPLAEPPPSDAGRLFFPATGHSLGGRFLEYWEANGGLAQFGLPLTEEVVEGGLTVQWFERARFELHPELAGEPGEVQLTPLGRTLWQHQDRR